LKDSRNILPRQHRADVAGEASTDPDSGIFTASTADMQGLHQPMLLGGIDSRGRVAQDELTSHPSRAVIVRLVTDQR
jgi:hypothetical protein